MSVVCVIPAKGNSRGIPGKNLIDFCGEPLVVWSIMAAKQCRAIDAIIVSTESEAVSKVAKSHGVSVHFRPLELAKDDVHSVHVVIDVLNNTEKEYDDVVMLLPTSPLRTAEDLNGAFLKYYGCDCDSVVSVCKYDKPLSCIRRVDDKLIFPVTPTENYETQRQQVKDYLVEVNGSIYISKTKNILNNKSFHIGRIAPFEMGKINSIDINTMDDLMIAKSIMLNRKNYE